MEEKILSSTILADIFGILLNVLIALIITSILFLDLQYKSKQQEIKNSGVKTIFCFSIGIFVGLFSFFVVTKNAGLVSTFFLLTIVIIIFGIIFYIGKE